METQGKNNSNLPLVRTSLNAKNYAKNYRKITGVSSTVPDMTLTSRELVDRHAKGLPFGGYKVPIYGEEDQQGINPEKLDLVDLQNMRIDNKKKINELQEKAQTEKSTNTI